jgi:hypothetical protein
MAKLPPKINLERLRAEEGEKLRQFGARVRTELAGLDGASARFWKARENPKRVKLRPRSWLRDHVAEEVRELWPRGVPARSAANPNRKLLRRLRPVCKQRGIHASDDTLLRALGRR